MVLRQFFTALALFLVAGALAGRLDAQELRGHGGPVRALAVGHTNIAVSGGFDTAVIVWSFSEGLAKAVLRGHEGAINAVLVSGSHFVSAGEDGRVIIWEKERSEPVRSIMAGTPILALALAPDEQSFAAAGFDGSVRLYDLNDGREIQNIAGGGASIQALAYATDGTLAFTSADGALRLWRKDTVTRTLQLASVAQRLVASRYGLIAACADGHIRLFNFSGDMVAEQELSVAPLLALAIDRAGESAVAASLDGTVARLNARSGQVLWRSRSSTPIWSLAVTDEGRILEGGKNGAISQRDIESGTEIGRQIASIEETIPAALQKTRGAQVFRACGACHSLNSDSALRAGPSLRGIIGRKIATAPNYRYSEALTHLDIVWTKETISKLFEVGPSVYTPGTKMPEQRLNEADRQALTEFLDQATR